MPQPVKHKLKYWMMESRDKPEKNPEEKKDAMDFFFFVKSVK